MSSNSHAFESLQLKRAAPCLEATAVELRRWVSRLLPQNSSFEQQVCLWVLKSLGWRQIRDDCQNLRQFKKKKKKRLKGECEAT